MERKGILITGASSLVGSKTVELLENQFDFHGLGTKEQPSFPGFEHLTTYQRCDLTDTKALERTIDDTPHNTILHIAAFTNVDEAEIQRPLGHESDVWQINVKSSLEVAKLAQKYNKRVIFASTSYVFDGRRGPYSESDETNNPNIGLMSFYGVTKLEAERVIKDNCDSYTFIRFEMPFRSDFSPKLDFARRILQLYGENKITQMFADQTISPILIDDLANAIGLIVKSDLNGAFHVGSSNITTPHEFACDLIKRYYQQKPLIIPSSYASTPIPEGKAPRPLKGGVLMSNIIRLGFKPRSTQEMIEDFYNQQKSLGLIGN